MNWLIVLKLYVLTVSLKSCYARQWNTKNVNTKLLSNIKSYMNSEINPCQDFYQYACGNWETIYTNSSNFLDTIGSLEYETNKKMKEILEQRISNKKQESNEIYHKVREYYETCKDQSKFDALEYLKVLKPTTDDDVEWPEINKIWLTKEKWNIWSSLGRLQAVGFNGFLITLDMKNLNATHFHLHLDKLQELGFSSYEQGLLDEMERSLNQKFRILATNIEGFIKKLSTLHNNHNQNFAIEMDLNELERKVINLDFKAYFTEFLGEQSLEQLPLVVANLAYFRKLADLIQKTSQETLIYTLKLKFLGYLEKQMPKTSSPLQCLQHMRDLVPLALDFIYEQEVYKYERSSSDVIIQKVFQTMKQKFSSIITEHKNEISKEEFEFLSDKLRDMKLNIGNLPQVTGDHFYHEYLNSWQVIKGYFYWNHLNVLQHHRTERFNMLNLKEYSPHHTFFHWPYGSPAYQPSANLLIIPHSYLQFPIFHPQFHELFLYAELGNTLGHEMIHAFDTNGLKYDSQGNPSSLFMESLPDKKLFMSFLACVNKQHPSSLNEKIADFNGFRLAYDSYFRQAFVSKFREETTLSNKQLFFIKFAQFFCAVSPKRIRYDDSHDTPFQRVPQVVANHRDFEDVFGCQRKVGKALVEKCNMW